MDAILKRLIPLVLLLCVASAQAATVTHAVTTASTLNVTSYASGAFTPVAGDQLVVFVVASGTVAAGTMTDSQGLGFDKIAYALYATSANTIYLFISRAGAAASSMTVTFDCTGDAATGTVIMVERVSGMSRFGANAARQTAKAENQASGGTPAATFASAALTGNPTLGAVGNSTNPATVTPPTSWTEQADSGYATPTTGAEDVSRDSGFTGTTITWGSTSGSAFGVLIVELDTSSLPAAPATPTKVQWRVSPLQNNVASTFQKMRLPNPSPGGNLVLAACIWSTSGSSANPTISDDHTNTWNTAIAVEDTTNFEKAGLFYAMNVAAGTSLVTATWATATSNNVCFLSEVMNVATTGASDGSKGQVVAASTTPSSGAFNTINNGDLVVHFVMDTTGHKQTFTAGTGMTKWQENNWSGAALQFQIQSAAGSTNPSITAGTSSRWLSVTAAFKPAAAGSDLASGIRVRGLNVLATPLFGTLAASMIFEVPTFSGNLLAVNWVDEDVTNPPTSITSSPANTFTNVTCAAVVATSTMEMRWVYVPSPSLSSDMTITFAYATTPSLATVDAVYEISGANTSPFDTCANASGNLAATSGTVTGPNLTPSTSNGLVLAAVQQSGDTVTAVPSPTGANMDNGDWAIYTLLTADQDGGYMNYLNPNTAAVQVNWTYSAYETPPTNVGNWGSQAVAFKAPAAPAGAPSNLPLMGCCGTAFFHGGVAANVFPFRRRQTCEVPGAVRDPF